MTSPMTSTVPATSIMSAICNQQNQHFPSRFSCSDRSHPNMRHLKKQRKTRAPAHTRKGVPHEKALRTAIRQLMKKIAWSSLKGSCRKSWRKEPPQVCFNKCPINNLQICTSGQNIVKYTQSNSPETSELRQDPLQYAQRLIWDDTSISSHDLLSVASELRSYASSLMAVASQLLSRAAQLSTGEPHPAGFITKSDTYPISVTSDVACENDNVAFGSARQLFTDGGSFLSSDSESDSESSDLDDTVSVDGHVDVDSIDDGGQIVCQDYGFCNPQAALGSDFPASAVHTSGDGNIDAALSLAIEMRDPDEWLDAQAAEANAEEWEEDDPEEDDGVECLEDGIRRGLIRMRWYMRLVSPRNNFQRTPLGNTPPLARTHRLLTGATFDVDLTTGTLADPIRINGGTHTETVGTENSFGSAPLPASEPDEYTAEDE